MLNRFVTHILRPILGWMFVFVGIIGLFLPILQGILFIVIGLVLLSSRYSFAHSLLQKTQHRYPREYEQMLRMKDRVLTSKPLLVTSAMLVVGLCVLAVYLLVMFARQTAIGL
ncbi:MAG: hypothetical protein HY710_14280 [Candidatus Latescibacteria bacterium]|nr:hypothetical protein [Candidatus Latescibacterota bacterium]